MSTTRTAGDVVGRPSRKGALWSMGFVTTVALYWLWEDIRQGGASGIAIAVGLGVALLLLGRRMLGGRPAFRVTDEGLEFPWIEGQVLWSELESMKVAGWSYESERLQVTVRDPAAIVARTRGPWRPLAVIYLAFGVASWLTIMNAIWSPLSLEELAAEIERRAGRPLLERV